VEPGDLRTDQLYGPLAGALVFLTLLVALVGLRLLVEELRRGGPAALWRAQKVWAAAVTTAHATAWYGLHDLARIKPGDKVLIHSGMGGVGQAAIAIARAADAEVIATAGSAERRQMLRDMGIEHVYDSRTVEFAEAIKRAIGLAFRGAGDPPDLTPFPTLDDTWIVSLVAGIGLYVAAAITLWLLLARRRRAAARLVFIGFFMVSTFLQSFFFTPVEKAETATHAPETAMTRGSR
jgi:threonine dehydrogenase-like Zn-dependent dehydrogenase